jgi:hypothetical protein
MDERNPEISPSVLVDIQTVDIEGGMAEVRWFGEGIEELLRYHTFILRSVDSSKIQPVGTSLVE